MIVSKRHKFVFVSVPRSATHTMYQVLTDEYGGRRMPGAYHQNLVPKRYRDRFRWAIVRNPYSRALSMWYLARGRPDISPTFAGFARMLATKNRERYEWPCPMHEWLAPAEPDLILKYEELPSCLSRLHFWDTATSLPRLHAANTPRRWWREYDQQMATHVQLWAGEDFERYGYAT